MDLFTDRKKLLKMKAKKNVPPPSSAGAGATKEKGKKRKRPVSSDVVVDVDYSIISLLDQMGDNMRGGADTMDEGTKAAEGDKASKKAPKGDAKASPSAVEGIKKKKKKRADDEAMPPPAGKAKAKDNTAPAKKEAPLPLSSSEESEAEEGKSYAGASEWELWRPGVVAPLEQLNLPWAVGGGKAILPSALPQVDPRVEVARLEAVKGLVDWLKTQAPLLLQRHEGRAAFVAWLQEASCPSPDSSEAADPILPSRGWEGGALSHDVSLGRALVSYGGVAPTEAADMCQELALRAQVACRELVLLRRQCLSRPPSREENGGGPVLRSRHHLPSLYLPLTHDIGRRLTLLTVNEAVDVSLLKGHEARVNTTHVHKLKALYCTRHVQSQCSQGPSAEQRMPRIDPVQSEKHYTKGDKGEKTVNRVGGKKATASSSSLSGGGEEDSSLKVTDTMHERLGAVLFRYLCYSGGWLEWEGERSLPASLMDLLWDRFECRLECFASPLNCRYPRYCSPFPDVDGYFGSVGSFWCFKPLQGAYVAHPPPLDTIVTHMAKHMRGLLSVTSRSLVFIVILPLTPSLSHGTRKLLLKRANNPHLTHKMTLPAGEHGFCIGAQHCLPRTHAPAPHDTALLIMQSKAAKASGRWAVSSSDETALREAFASYAHEDQRDRLGPPPKELFRKQGKTEEED